MDFLNLADFAESEGENLLSDDDEKDAERFREDLGLDEDEIDYYAGGFHVTNEEIDDYFYKREER